MDKTPCCFYQIFGSKTPVSTQKEGHGDCGCCVPSPEDNPKCTGFYPAPRIRKFEVKSDRLLYLLLLGISLMSCADLYATIFHAINFGLFELNPIAAFVLAGGVFSLVMFKMGATGITVGSLLKANEISKKRSYKSRITIYLGTWIMFLVMSWLTYYWYVYTDFINENAHQIMKIQTRSDAPIHKNDAIFLPQE